MKRAIAIVLTFVFACAATITVLAHPFTFKGAVTAVTPTKLSVTVKDEKTGKPVVKAFEIDKETKILRGDDVVTFAAAHIVKGEQVSVTVNLDEGDDLADVIRLSPKK